MTTRNSGISKPGLKLENVEIRWVEDHHDNSEDDLGFYTNDPPFNKFYIDREARGDWKEPEYRYWVPSRFSPIQSNPFNREYQKYANEEYIRMEALGRGEWRYEGCVAVATASYHIDGHHRLQELQSAGIWGVASYTSMLKKVGLEIEQLYELREHVMRFNVPWGPVGQVQIQKRLNALQEMKLQLTGNGSGQFGNINA